MESTSEHKWQRFSPNKLSKAQRILTQSLFARGELRFLLHPGQLRIWNDMDANGHITQVICVARQWGKRHMLVTKAVSHAIQHPGSSIHYGAPTKEQVEKIVVPKLNEILKFAPDDLQPHKKEDTWTFANGSEIVIVGTNVNKGNRLRGLSSDLTILDEVRDIPNLRDLLESIIKPMFTTTDGMLIMASTPPDSPSHDFVAVFVDEAIQGGYFHHGTYKDNPLITERQMRTYNEKEGIKEGSDRFKREHLADYTVTDANNRVIKSFDSDENKAFFETWNPPRKMRPYVRIDVGSRDKTAIIFGLYDWANGVLVMLEEAMLSNPTTDDIAKVILEKEQTVWKRWPDHEEPTRISDIDPRLMMDLRKGHNLKVGAVRNKNVDAMINRFTVNLQNGKIRIDPKCHNLIFQIKTGVWNSKRLDYERSEKGGHLDALDAALYMHHMCKYSEVFNMKGELLPDQMRVRPEKPERERMGILDAFHGAHRIRGF